MYRCVLSFLVVVIGWTPTWGLEPARVTFELPPSPARTRPRPFDGETLVVNPPCFVYPATKQYDAYVVQYSGSRDFPRAETFELMGKWMLNAPARPLDPGIWYWRWRPAGPAGSGTIWSPVRRFRIPDDVPIVPFPKLSELTRRLGRSHPRVFITADRLEAVRQRAAKRFGAEWRNQVQRRAALAAKKQLLPEPAFLPAKGLERIEQYKATFVRYRPFFGELTALAQTYLLSGNRLAGSEAKRRLMSVVAWDPNGSTSLKHNDEVGTDVVRHCVRAYDWVYPLLSAQERQQCLDVFRVRMEEMFDLLRRRPFEVAPYPSHFMGYYEPDLLQACLAVSGDMDVEPMLHYTMLQLWSPFYPPYGDADGGWSEGPSYWGWIAGVCARTYVLVQRATGIPIHERSNLRNQAFYKLYGNPPWFQMSPFGDGQEGPARGGQTMLMLASLYHNPWAKWYAQQKQTRLQGLDALLFPTRDLEARSPADLPQGRCFFDVGLACSHVNLGDRGEDVTLLMRSSPFGGSSHAYADQNTFVVDAHGQPLIIASGYYQLYGCPHHVQWTRRTVASNSILVDNQGQERSWSAKGRIMEFTTTVGADYMVGDAHEAYPGRLDRYDRHVLFLRPMQTGGNTLIVIHDDIVAPKPVTIQFLLHALQPMQVDSAKGSVRVHRADAVCRVDLLAPQRLEFHQDDQFTVAPQVPSPNQWHLRAGTTTKRKTTQSLITLQPARHALEKQLVRPVLERGSGAVGVVLGTGRRRVVAIFRTSSEADTVRACGLRTDGAAASATWIDGRVRAVALFDGSVLASSSGRNLIRTGEATSVNAVHLANRLLVEGANQHPMHVELATLFSAAGVVGHAGATEPVPIRDGMMHLDLPPGQLIRIDARDDKATAADKPASLIVPGAAPTHFQCTFLPRVQATKFATPFPGTPGIWQLGIQVSAVGGAGGMVRLDAGGGRATAWLAPGQVRTVAVNACSLNRGDPVTVSWSAAAGGQLRLGSAKARRALGVNLVANGSFEDVADGVPVGCRPGTITAGAQCRIETAANVFAGRATNDGQRCVKVICTAATGGDFGVALEWPGVRPAPYDRRFRLACQVRGDRQSVAGVQVTSDDWVFCQTTPRISSPDKWARSEHEFVLPAGEDLGHLRLHMSARKTGAVLYVDSVSLVELPAAVGDKTGYHESGESQTPKM